MVLTMSVSIEAFRKLGSLLVAIPKNLGPASDGSNCSNKFPFQDYGMDGEPKSDQLPGEQPPSGSPAACLPIGFWTSTYLAALGQILKDMFSRKLLTFVRKTI